MLRAVEVNDLGDDVQILAGADAVWDIVAGEVEVVICTVCKLEVRAVRRVCAVVSGVDEEIKPRFVSVVGSYISDISVKLNCAPLVF